MVPVVLLLPSSREGSFDAVLLFCSVVVVSVFGNVSGKNRLCITAMSLMGQ